MRWLAAAAVALVACLTFGAQLIHMTVIQHAVCAEHGELVELAPGERAEAPTRAATDAASSVFDGTQPQHDHGHCTALVDAHALVSAPPPAPLTVLVWEHLDPRPPATFVASRTDLHRLAPKTSPPA
jgi:hypothetical protein